MSTENFFEKQSPESRVKARIVAAHFATWAKVVSKKYVGPLAYLDLFAGPGAYKDGNKSTPLMIAEYVANQPALSDRVKLVYNEADPELAGELETNVRSVQNFSQIRHPARFFQTEVLHDYDDFLNSVDRLPALLFVDPWGYKGVSLNLFDKFTRGSWGRDVIFFFNYKRITANLSIHDEKRHEHMQRMFGAARAAHLRQTLPGLGTKDREQAVLAAMTEALGEIGIAYVQPFEFSVRSDRLFFGTRHPRGVDVIRNVMMSVSQVDEDGFPSFKTPDVQSGPEQQAFGWNKPPSAMDELKIDLLSRFKGRTVSFEDIFDEHLQKSSRGYLRKNYREALRRLETDGRIAVITLPGSKVRRVGTFGPSVKVIFLDQQGG